MKKTAKMLNESGRLYISRPTEYGASVVQAEPPLEKYDIVSFDEPNEALRAGGEPPAKRQKAE